MEVYLQGLEFAAAHRDYRDAVRGLLDRLDRHIDTVYPAFTFTYSLTGGAKNMHTLDLNAKLSWFCLL